MIHDSAVTEIPKRMLFEHSKISSKSGTASFRAYETILNLIHYFLNLFFNQ